MYFWRIKDLKNDLKARPLTEREALPYLIVCLVLSSLLCSISPSVDEFNFWDGMNLVSAVLFSIFGTVYLYRKNGGDAGSQFISRYLALGWVVAIRWFTAAFFPFLVIVIALDLPEENNWFMFSYFFVALFVYYWRTGLHIKEVATHGNASEPT